MQLQCEVEIHVPTLNVQHTWCLLCCDGISWNWNVRHNGSNRNNRRYWYPTTGVAHSVAVASNRYHYTTLWNQSIFRTGYRSLPENGVLRPELPMYAEKFQRAKVPTHSPLRYHLLIIIVLTRSNSNFVSVITRLEKTVPDWFLIVNTRKSYGLENIAITYLIRAVLVFSDGFHSWIILLEPLLSRPHSRFSISSTILRWRP